MKFVKINTKGYLYRYLCKIICQISPILHFNEKV